MVDRLSRGLAARGHEVHVVTPVPKNDEVAEGKGRGVVERAGEGAVIEEGSVPGIIVHRVHGPPGFRGTAEIRRMRDEVVAIRPDVVHGHFAKSEGLASNAAARRLGVPSVVTVHGSDVMREYGGQAATAWSRMWVSRALRGASAVTAVSRALSDMARTIAPVEIRVIHNGVTVPETTPTEGDRRGARARLAKALGADPSDEDTLLVFTARRLVEKNGLDLLLRGAASARKGVHRVLVGIAGAGPEEERLRPLAGPAGARLLGRVSGDDLADFTLGCDVYAVPSRFEGFGLVVLEAMAVGRPVLATAVGGIPEIVRSATDGILVEPTPEGLAGGLERLAKDPGSRERMGRAALERARSFTWDRMVEDYEAVYRELVGGPVP